MAVRAVRAEIHLNFIYIRGSRRLPHKRYKPCYVRAGVQSVRHRLEPRRKRMFGAEQNEDHHEEATPQSKNRNPIIWMGAAVVLMAIAGLVALASNHHQQSTVNQLTARESQMNAQIGTLQDRKSTRLNSSHPSIS